MTDKEIVEKVNVVLKRPFQGVLILVGVCG